jgi:hypothetical protein
LLRCYLNNGEGKLTKLKTFPAILSNAHTLVVEDLNQDGFPDIFLGSAYKAQRYPLPGNNQILINDGQAHFKILENHPFEDRHVNAAVIIDFDQDGINEIITVGEWEPMRIHSLVNDEWVQEYQATEKGWYNTVAASNLDNDPELEFILGNLGNNSLWIASRQKPIVVYYGDFDQNNTLDPILSCYLGENSYPLVSRDDLIGQLPRLKKFFTSYQDYASIDMKTLLTHLPNASSDTINEISSIIYDVSEDGLKKIILPIQAQISSIHSILTFDIDQDQDLDLILTGNNHYNRVRIGEMDANHGVVLENINNLNFKSVSNLESGLYLKGDVRSSVVLPMKNGKYLLFGVNNQALVSYRLNDQIVE